MKAKRLIEGVVDGSFKGNFYREYVSFSTLDGQPLMMERRYSPSFQKTKGTVLLIHGFAQNRYSWHLKRRSMVNYLAIQGYDVFNIDLRGHGLSRKAGSSYPESLEQYVDHDLTTAVKEIRDLTGHKRVFIMGHSLGGALCYALASRIPEMIRGIVTFGGVYFFGKGNPIIYYTARFVSQLDQLTGGINTGAIRFVPLNIVGLLMAQFLPLLNSPRLYRIPITAWEPGSIEYMPLLERVVRGFDRTGINILRLMIRWAAEGVFESMDGSRDYARAFRNLNIPLLVITGNRDTLCTHDDAYPAFSESRSKDKTYKMFTRKDGNVIWGHIDLICGRKAPQFVWPYVSKWLEER